MFFKVLVVKSGIEGALLHKRWSLGA
jgi:hypothetical protein